MPDARLSATSVLSPTPKQAGLDALGIVDLGSPSPSPGEASASGVGSSSQTTSGSTVHDVNIPHNGGAGRGHPQHQPPHSHHSRYSDTQSSYRGTHTTTADSDLSAEALGLPPDAEISRVPEGERYRVRAVYDFEATDESALSFRAGDVIEVLTLLPSGWWDGMLGANRGWFPSNYVEDYEDDDESRYGDYVEMGPDGSIIHRNGSAVADILGVDESLGRDWGGRDWGMSGSMTSIDDLVLEMMDNDGQPRHGHHAMLANAVEQASQRRRTDSLASRASRSSRVSRSSRTSYQSAGYGGPPAVTAGARRSGDDDHRHDDPDETLHASMHARSHRDAWVPSLTLDGRVYYHNTTTGEDAWYLPEGAGELGMSRSDSRASSQPPPEDPGHARVHSTGASHRTHDSQDLRHLSSYDRARHVGSTASSMASGADDFRIPPNHRTRQGQLPYPWVARMTDDGRNWFYFNQATGETRRDLPPPTPTTATSDASGQDGTASARRPSVSTVASAALSVTRPPRRSSLRHSQVDWEDRIRMALAPLYAPPLQPTIGDLMDRLRISVNDLYETAMTGSDVQAEKEEAERAHVGMQQALAKDYAACAALNECERVVVEATRDLYLALGYVGPAIPPSGAHDSVLSDDLVRPQWCNDMSLVGVLGLIASTVRVATEGVREGSTSQVPWDHVMRAATKMRATLEVFPAFAHIDQAERDSTGRDLIAWFGAESVGDFMSGRFGFGAQDEEIVLRPLDQSAVVEVQKLKAEVDAALRAGAVQPDGAVFELIRSSSLFRDAIAHIDVAVVIDLDGDQGNTTDTQHPEDARHYAELVTRARTALQDLDEACLSLDAAAADIFLHSDEAASPQSREAVGQAVSTVFRALSSLLVVAQQQAATVEQGVVRGSIGGRSPAQAPSGRHTRGPSAASVDSTHPAHTRLQSQHTRNTSAGSSDSRQTRATGSEQEFLDGDERRSTAERPSTSSNRLSRTSQPSASASQTSLVKAQGPSSSSTSLGQQADSEAGSIRGSNRSSILKAVPSFLRTSRSDSVSQTKAAKKLSRIKDDRSSMIMTTPAPMAAPPAAAMRSSPPWYLSSDYPPGDIVFDEEKGSVKAGTIRALIERLTPHTSADTTFFQAFLLTYRSFVTTDELVALLLERYNIEAPADLNDEQMKEWKLRKQTPIRLRVANTLKTWLEHHYMEEQDRNALDVVEDFATTTLMANGSDLMSKQLLQLVDRRRRGDATTKNRILMSGAAPAPPILPRIVAGRPLTLLDIPPLELARQLTILEFNLYTKLRPAEFLHKNWQRLESETLSPNIGKVISTANNIAGWIQKMVLSQKDVKQRAAYVKHLIRTAIECRDLNNFSSMAAVVAGLSASSIQRLRQTWTLQSEKTMRDWGAVEQSMDPSKNFQRQKEMLKTVNPPCVPFLGLYLSMLVFIEDGNRDYVPAPVLDANGNAMVRSPTTPGMSRTASLGSSAFDSRASFTSLTPSNATSTTAVSAQTNGTAAASTSSTLVASTSSAASSNANTATNGANGTNGGDKERPMLINFFKRGLTAELLRDIQQYQAQPFNLAPCKPVSDWLDEGLRTTNETAEELYELSLVVEPKERASAAETERRIRRMNEYHAAGAGMLIGAAGRVI